jgi:hypothetical protein
MALDVKGFERMRSFADGKLYEGTGEPSPWGQYDFLRTDVFALLDRLERAETVVEMACAVMGEGDYGAATELERQLLASIQRWREAAKP